MKKFCSILCMLLTMYCLSAQSSVVPTGGTVTYTVGQIAAQNNSDGPTSISEGVQQPYEIQTIGIDNYPGITLNAVVYLSI